jgi:DNA-binding SARP family transcriptional activator
MLLGPVADVRGERAIDGGASVAATGAATTSSLLGIRLLGDLELRRGGEPLVLPASRRTRALLGFLVATGAPHSRASLCDLLWEGTDDPRASLRWSLTKLRPVVDAAPVERLVADREHVAFAARGCAIDVERVSALLRGGVAGAPLDALEEAAGLLQREFLDGLDLPACYRFQHWCMAERERHGTLRRAVLDALVQRLEATPARALPYARAMVAADPLAEAAHATLLRLLAADGRYPEAERHYDWARDLLRREVAAPPGGLLDEAIHRIRRGLRGAGAGPPDVATIAGQLGVAPAAGPHHAAATPDPLDAATAVGAPDAWTDAAAAPAHRPPPTRPAAAAGRAAAAPLVGRAAECARLEARLADGADARPFLLLLGEPGIGKTRLLDHLADAAIAAGQRVMRGRCFEAEMVRPYGPWLDALRGLDTAGVPADVLAQAAPLLDSRAAGDGTRARLFDAAAALVRALAAGHALVLIFDDLQWIDEGSAALLHYVARTLEPATPAVLAGAARAGEIEDNPWARGLLQSLARAQGVERLVLAPLGDADARTLLGATPADIDAALRQAGGNPLYLGELARAAAYGDGSGQHGLDALVEARLDALDAADRDLLAWAAAMGGELRPELLAAAAGRPLAEVLARIERCEQRGLLRASGAGRFDFVHGLVRQVIYRRLSQARRQTLHRLCARALVAASDADPWLHGEVVRHAGLAGDAAGVARASVAAGEQCLRVYANVQAGAVAERGLAAVDELPGGAERVGLEIALLRLCVAAAAGSGGRRLPALTGRIELAIATAEALGLHAQAASGWEILSFWRQRAGDAASSQAATLAAAQRTRAADAATRCRQLANSGRCLLDIEADCVRGQTLLDEAGALAAQLDLQVMEIDWGRGLLARRAGDLDAACDALARAVGLARLTENHWREFECMVWLATAEYEHGRDAAALEHLRAIVAAAAGMGEPDAPYAQALGALARLRQGGDATAAADLDASVVALRELDDKAHLAYVLNEQAGRALALGRADVAAACATEALAAARAVRRPTEVAVATARLAQATGRPHDAAAALAGLLPAERSARGVAALQAAARGGATGAAGLA